MQYPALVIDTSTRYLLFARLDARGVGLLTVKTAAAEGESAVDSAVAELFPDLGGLAEIWLGSGPGSFVGLRSSFAYVRMLAMLRGVPCRTFLSSRLWRSFFGVAPEAWFLTRTNARLYYAERYLPAREAQAVEVSAAAELAGEKFCFYDSWLPTASGAKVRQGAGVADSVYPPAKILHFAEAKMGTELLTPEILCPGEPVQHTTLEPLYGHELNFALADHRQQATKNT